MSSVTRPAPIASSNRTPVATHSAPRQDKRGLPGPVVGQDAGDERGHRDADTAAHPVPAKSLAPVCDTPHHPGNPHRMVDRAEEPDGCKPEGDLERCCRKTGQHGAATGSQEEDHHHARRTPPVTDVSRRQCHRAEQHVSCQHQADQLVKRQVEHPFEGDYHRRVDQHHEMRVGVADIREGQRGAASDVGQWPVCDHECGVGDAGVSHVVGAAGFEPTTPTPPV